MRNSTFCRLTDRATTTLGDLADGAGFSRTSMDKWRSGERPVGRVGVLRLARYLRRRARDLDRIAAELESIEGGGNDYE
jgi:hypothetical protein